MSNYTVRALTQEEIGQQKQNFDALLQELGQAPSTEIEKILAKREIVQPEAELTPKIIARFEEFYCYFHQR
jgi:hypothetical protein